mmetsp:Transcript_114971/g.161560  ORF Transcript_114971/g.161560 Transcript_114971/m.161560 type:complete len:91 (+) Transcript_114971:202-474(+)
MMNKNLEKKEVMVNTMKEKKDLKTSIVKKSLEKTGMKEDTMKEKKESITISTKKITKIWMKIDPDMKINGKKKWKNGRKKWKKTSTTNMK